MNEQVSPEIKKLLRKLDEANARIAALEKREAEKDIKIEKQSAEIKAQKDEINNLKETIASLMGQQFGKRAEEYIPEIKTEVFNTETIDTPQSAENRKEKPIFREHEKSKVIYLKDEETKKKSCGRQQIGEGVPVKEVIRKIPEEEMTCQCGARLRKVGEESTVKIVAPPRKFHAIRIVREKCQCPVCEGITYSDKSVVKIAPIDKTLFPKALVTPSLAANIICNKYNLHIPYYRQQYAFAYRHFNISRENMTNWQETAYEGLKTLEELYHSEVISGNVLHVDETPIQIIRKNNEEICEELGKIENDKKREKSYIWVLMGGKKNHPVLEYNFRWTRSKNNVLPLLEGFSGYLMTDGLSSYHTTADEYNEKHDEKIISCGCNAHSRRKFYDAWKNGNDLDATPALDIYHEIYDVERNLRPYYERGKISAEDFVEQRKKKVLPLFEELENWMKVIQPKVRPKSKLGKAVDYTLNQFERLKKYLDCADLTPDNNECESLGIRPFTVGRNNWKFNVSGDGARSSCFMFSMVQTAKANGLVPEDYMRNVFEKAPYCETQEDWKKLLPWNIEITPFNDEGEWV